MANERVRLIVVDAANVVGSRPDGWWRDRAGATRRLLAEIAGLHGHLTQPTEIVVVLEGAARAAAAGREDRDGVRVVTADGSGDDAIVAVVSAALDTGGHETVTVVTADRGLRARVEALGASTVGPRWLLDRIAPSG